MSHVIYDVICVSHDYSTREGLKGLVRSNNNLCGKVYAEWGMIMMGGPWRDGCTKGSASGGAVDGVVAT